MDFQLASTPELGERFEGGRKRLGVLKTRARG